MEKFILGSMTRWFADDHAINIQFEDGSAEVWICEDDLMKMLEELRKTKEGL